MWLLWGLDDLVARLIELPERDDLYPRLNDQFIAKEIDALSQEAAPDAPAPEQMTLDLGAGPLVLHHVDTVNIYVTIAASAGTDGGPPQVIMEGQ